MFINLQSHSFAGNPLLLKSPKQGEPFSPTHAVETLKSRLLDNTHVLSSPKFMILLFRNGRPLTYCSTGNGDSTPIWHLGWIALDDFKELMTDSGVQYTGDSLVYLGSHEEKDVIYCAIDVSDTDRSLVPEVGSKQSGFVELRTLMVATDWADAHAMGQLAIAGHARALLEWHRTARFCGHCGEKTVPVEAGRRKQCSNETCRKRIYPRIDPVVIMLVIDRENDLALLSKQSRIVPKLWTSLAGFVEPGESLEEAVRRETWEETGIEVGEVVYHSSQPWPVGSNSMPCQLMVGFYAYAKSLEINVDRRELEDAQWHSREEIRKALTFAEYNKTQRTAASRVEKICKGLEKGQSMSADFNVETSELATMVVPGPFAIAHHLISSWAYQGVADGTETA